MTFRERDRGVNEAEKENKNERKTARHNRKQYFKVDAKRPNNSINRS
jgi:hypothetical protein